VNATVPAAPLPLEKQILWPTFIGHGDAGRSDSSAFPRLQAIKARHGASLPEALNAFVEAAQMAQQRILVLDRYLFKPKEGSQRDRFDQILSWLPDALVANEIRFLTDAHSTAEEHQEIQNLFRDRVAALNQKSSHRNGRATIEIKFTLAKNFPYVHDRFAIIDNELWHFGATVGGLHNHVTAATRGWDAQAHDAERFFNDAWKGDSDLQL